MVDTTSTGKAFDIPKQLVWEAYQKVKANKGAAGVDGQSLTDFAQDEKNNLYKIWNRMSSGSYFPPPVRAAQIPKPGRVGARARASLSDRRLTGSDAGVQRPQAGAEAGGVASTYPPPGRSDLGRARVLTMQVEGTAEAQGFGLGPPAAITAGQVAQSRLCTGPGVGAVRVLGVPTVADRIAQTVVAQAVERDVEPIFHTDSYGYRPGRSALDAVSTCQQRCWKYPWVLDLDIQSFFDTVPHEPILQAVARHTESAWVLLYVRRWLAAPIQHADGSVRARDRGTPQGSAISPLLSNLFMHYAFDAWMRRKFPRIGFERYCDDVIVHCHSPKQAAFLREKIADRLGGFGLHLHPEKTRIVHCLQSGTTRSPGAPVEFTFLGYTFRPRCATRKDGSRFLGFLPAVSKAAMKAMAATIRGWSLGRRTGHTFHSLAAAINPVVAGWINYYGRFYKSLLIRFLAGRINPQLVKWAMRKHKHLHRAPAKARKRLARIARQHRNLFAHWQHGALPTGAATGAV